MTDLKGNMSYKYDSDECLCKESKEIQSHILENCKIYENDNNEKWNTVTYLEII